MENKALNTAYKNPALPVSDRVENLLSQMTIEEKVAQLCGNGVMAGKFHDIAQEIPNGCGHINGSFLLGESDAEARAKSIEEIQRYLVEETRLGIPALFHMEVTSGSFFTDAVTAPVAIAMGATFDRNAVGEMAGLIGRQNRAEGYNHAFGPVLDVGRDQRWGRLGETYGEDPTLIAAMGSAYVEGLQGHGDWAHYVGATGKHFLGYSMSEDAKNIGNQRIPERELREVHLKPWAAAVEAGMSTVMNAYGVINGEPVVSSRHILTGLLRDELGFKGLTVADYCSINRCVENYETTESYAEAGKMALEAGLDVELPDPTCFNGEFTQWIKDGIISMERIDEAVRRVLELKFKLGLFEHPYPDYSAIAALKKAPENETVSRKLSEESIVMTKNNGVLPLKKSAKIAVIGPNGNNKRCFYGSYTYAAMLEMKANLSKMFVGMEGMGGAMAAAKEEDHFAIEDIEEEIAWRYPETCSLVDALQAAGAKVQFAQGCEIQGNSRSGFAEAFKLAQEADIVILALGGRGGQVDGCTSGEGIEVPEIGLLGVQAELAKSVIEIGKPTVLLHMDVRPMANAEVTEAADAILECWYGGTWGSRAITEILFGEISPSGKLPLTCLAGPQQNPSYLGQLRGCGHVNPATEIQKSPMMLPDGPGIPDDVADTPRFTQRPDAYKPLFYFGHGLSYTSFEYSDLRMPESIDVCGSGAISFSVRNTGAMAGDEVVQLYFHDACASMVRPVVELAGFCRIHLEPGEKKRVTFQFDASQTAFVDGDNNWRVEPGKVYLMVGSSSVDIRLNGFITLTGQTSIIPAQRTYFSSAVLK